MHYDTAQFILCFMCEASAEVWVQLFFPFFFTALVTLTNALAHAIFFAPRRQHLVQIAILVQRVGVREFFNW